MDQSQPSPVGLKKSFGYGDRLGLATPGHLAANQKSGFAPIFAQQSIREMTRTQRSPEEVMQAARKALATAQYNGVWGADADHLKTPEDVKKTAQAGFRMFTIDPSEHVNNEADDMDRGDLRHQVETLESSGAFPDPNWQSFYLHQTFEIDNGLTLGFTERDLWQAAVKYGAAIAFSESLSRHIADANEGRPYEIEVSVDETDSPTSPLEHLFIGQELKRRGVEVVSLAPRFVGDFEKGVDYRGDLQAFEDALKQHVAIARYCGPYKISVHSGSDKFSIYPIIGRVCGDLLHVKTAGTSYLEALRVVARSAPKTFAEIAEFCRGRFAEDRKSYHISTSDADIAALPPFQNPNDESRYLDDNVGRQLLHVTFGSVIASGQSKAGAPFKQLILETLNQNQSLHDELVDRHLTKHLSLLEKG